MLSGGPPVAATPPRQGDGSEPNILELRDLQVHFRTGVGIVKAVDGVSFDVPAGGSLGIVGESGSGKSVTSLAIMRLIEPPGRVVGGHVLFKGEDIVGFGEERIRRLRGDRICLVFQDPMAALNPVYTVGRQVEEVILAHKPVSRGEARGRTLELLRMVGIPSPELRIDEYPHRLSGGMRQRITIAMALANEPDLLILDEPTTALDVTIQAQILDLIRDLRRRISTTVLLITHDIGVIEEMCDNVVVMYGGRVMETGPTEAVTTDPKHPYTAGLLASIPHPELRGHRLNAIGGSVPSPLAMPPGCPFAPRCPRAMQVCATRPPLKPCGEGRSAACWLH
jgi:oligopeptide/dipeptide ABC transporter ATP-binding protein